MYVRIYKCISRHIGRINENHIVYKHKFSVQAFKEKYLVDNIIG